MPSIRPTRSCEVNIAMKESVKESIFIKEKWGYFPFCIGKSILKNGQKYGGG